MIVHADVDAFFASVVRRDSPHYRGRPFVVAQDVVVACASYEARALGIHAGMPLARVRRQWPGVPVAPPSPDAYRQASAALFALFRRYTPLVEPGSLEEAFLDMTGRIAGDPARFAAELRRVVGAELGLPVSVGIGSTKLWAKLASREAKPDGAVVLDATREAELRPRLRFADLWGVGPASVAKLHEANLFTVGDLAGHDEDSLKEIVPTAMARRLVAIAAGTDDATVRARGPRQSVGAQRTISPPTRARSTVLGTLRAMVETALSRLDPGADPRRLEVIVRFDDGARLTNRGPLADRVAIAAAAERLLADTGYEDDGRGVSLVGVTLFLSTRPAAGQLALPLDGSDG